jgi:PAS domain S-box-containing protein
MAMAHDGVSEDAPGLAFLRGGGEMGARMRAFDWTRTSLGAPAHWPKALKTCVRIVLTSRQPMFVWWGAELTNLYNDAYKSIVGGKHPEALGQPAAVVWREIWPQIAPRVASSLSDNEGTYDEALLLIMERNGYPEETYYTFSYSPVPDDHGVATGIFCANTDHTQLVIGRRQLALLRELAATTAHSETAAGACMACARTLESELRDLPFSLLYLVDEPGERLTLAGCAGISREHAAARASVSLHDDGVWPMREALRAAEPVLVCDLTPLGELPSGAWPVAPRQAALLPLSSSGAGGVTGVLVVGLNPYRLYDDAYRGFLELVAGQISTSLANAATFEAEKARAAQLAELDRAKTAFFSNVSHEFRTPLTLMLGPLEEALTSPARTLAGENLATTYRNAVRLLKLVNTLLDFSRIEAGRARARYVPTDLTALTRDLASAFRSAMTRAGLAFDVRCDDLGEPVFVDHDMWEKIVLNLLSNALKFTFEGTVTLTLSRREQALALTVSDTGTGIPEAELPSLFQRFHRVHNARARTHEGSGIGLALVAELVKMQGGRIDVESREGAGTSFRVTLPFGHEHLPRDQVSTDAPFVSTALGTSPYVQEALRWLPGRSEAESFVPCADTPLPMSVAAPGPRARILLADDNADMREYVTRLLSERFDVVAVPDGAAALAEARRVRPDVVLSDVMMPTLDGLGLLRALRSEPALMGVPVILLSARAGEESRVEGLEAGADDYLPKPFASRELIARVSTHIELGRLRSAAEREREKLVALFSQAPAPIAVLEGPELTFSLANQPFGAMVDKSDLLGRTLHDALPELAGHPLVHALEQVRASGEAVRTRELGMSLRRGGRTEEAFFEVVAQPIRDLDGQVTGVMVVASELTEQVQARRRVEQLRLTAEQASRAKDEFLSTLSHELRTPLNAIVGWSQMLRSGSVPAAQYERALETIDRNARVQARLIDDMLDLARIEQGKVVLSVGPIDVKRVVEAAVEAVRPAAEAKGVRLQVVLDSHATIVGDSDRLQQIVWNLLSNSIKFTPKGGRVQAYLRREQSHVEISVADSGQGIEPAFLPHVFDRFRQGDGSFARRAGGLGLGLAIVRSLVELHGGVVTAASEGPGRGATFVVKLPTAPIRADHAQGRADAEPGLRHPQSFDCPAVLKGLHVLVVDDEHDTRELLRFVIAQCDAHVTTASSASEALTQLARQRFDVILSDVGMPGEDGYALMRRVRALAPEQNGRIPALALTAYARSEDRMQALRAGFNMHLAKPIDASELLVVLATLIGG